MYGSIGPMLFDFAGFITLLQCWCLAFRHLGVTLTDQCCRSRWATFIGLAMLVACSPATGFFVKRLTGLRRRMLIETDSRVKLMNQLLTGIRVLKLYAWEAAQEASVCTPSVASV